MQYETNIIFGNGLGTKSNTEPLLLFFRKYFKQLYYEIHIRQKIVFICNCIVQMSQSVAKLFSETIPPKL